MMQNVCKRTVIETDYHKKRPHMSSTIFGCQAPKNILETGEQRPKPKRHPINDFKKAMSLFIAE